MPTPATVSAQRTQVDGTGAISGRATSAPLAIDLFCGLGGWTEGLLAEGYEVVGYDIEAHEYWAPEDMGHATGGRKGTKPVEKRGWTAGCAIALGAEGPNAKPRTKLLRYPAKLVIADVLTLHGAQFKDAALIVASPPCQEYSYMAMPWSKAKAKAEAIRADETGQKLADLNRLFHACFRIQAEASLAAGRHVPMVVENVRGAQPWVGRARWNFGSFYLWGDVPAIMPMASKAKMSGRNLGRPIDGEPRKIWGPNHVAPGSEEFANLSGQKNTGGSWFNIGSPGQKVTGKNPVHALAGIKQPGIGGTRTNGKGDAWFQDGAARHGSKSNSRKMASAMIAKIPEPLCRHIAAVYRPQSLANLPDHHAEQNSLPPARGGVQSVGVQS